MAAPLKAEVLVSHAKSSTYTFTSSHNEMPADVSTSSTSSAMHDKVTECLDDTVGFCASTQIRVSFRNSTCNKVERAEISLIGPLLEGGVVVVVLIAVVVAPPCDDSIFGCFPVCV